MHLNPNQIPISTTWHRGRAVAALCCIWCQWGMFSMGFLSAVTIPNKNGQNRSKGTKRTWRNGNRGTRLLHLNYTQPKREDHSRLFSPVHQCHQILLSAHLHLTPKTDWHRHITASLTVLNLTSTELLIPSNHLSFAGQPGTMHYTHVWVMYEAGFSTHANQSWFIVNAGRLFNPFSIDVLQTDLWPRCAAENHWV